MSKHFKVFGGVIHNLDGSVGVVIIWHSTMGAEKKKTMVKKVKVLTKRDKVHRRTARVNKAVALKRKARTENKKKASLHRRKLAAVGDN